MVIIRCILAILIVSLVSTAGDAETKTLYLCDTDTTLLLTDRGMSRCRAFPAVADLTTASDSAWQDSAKSGIGMVNHETLENGREAVLETESTAPVLLSEAKGVTYGPWPRDRRDRRDRIDGILQEFVGKGTARTRQFTIQDEWGVEWQATDRFRLMVYTVHTRHPTYEDTMRSVVPQVLANTVRGGSGSALLQKGGTYRFVVSALGPWSLRVVGFALEQ